MFEAIFGNKNVEKILLFLFVNQKCYGAELQRHLSLPLTPLQKLLTRLEKEGLLISHYEGKTRLYRFNPAFPLLQELEQLLKKAYTLLPPNEKKRHLILAPNTSKNRLQTLLEFWQRLTQVSQLTFVANTKGNSGWKGKGKGEVVVTKVDPKTLLFEEKGRFTTKEGQEMQFSNVFRWTLDRTANVITLEHLRRGPKYPVFLFHLLPATQTSLSSVDSHLCGGDTYFGGAHFDRYHLKVHWRVIGPKKDEEIDYFYS
jgi:hypothetical protein